MNLIPHSQTYSHSSSLYNNFCILIAQLFIEIMNLIFMLKKILFSFFFVKIINIEASRNTIIEIKFFYLNNGSRRNCLIEGSLTQPSTNSFKLITLSLFTSKRNIILSTCDFGD